MNRFRKMHVSCGLEYTSMKTSVRKTFQPLQREFLFIESVYYLSMQATVNFMETVNNTENIK